jgi:hypothetical protein
MKNIKFKKSNLDSWFVSGFAEAESALSVSIYINQKTKLGWAVKDAFQIGLHSRDLQLLYKLKTFFGCGQIYIKKNQPVAFYHVASIKILINLIIPHFGIVPFVKSKGCRYNFV